MLYFTFFSAEELTRIRERSTARYHFEELYDREEIYDAMTSLNTALSSITQCLKPSLGESRELQSSR